MTYRFDGGELLNNLFESNKKAYVAARMLAQQGALEMQNYARINRPWKDRTGRAKQSLTATVEEDEGYKLRIKLAHGVDYGIYLELANEKKYAIIAPTIRIKGPVVLQAFRKFIKAIIK